MTHSKKLHLEILIILIVGIILISGCVKQDKTEINTHSKDLSDLGIKENKEGHEDTERKEEFRQSRQSPLFTDLSQCDEKEVQFTSSPLDIDVIRIIEPQGELTDRTSGHITPGDHMGMQYPQKGGPYKLYAMADGYIVRIERQPHSPLFGLTNEVENLHIYFEYSCNLFGSYVHVTSLTEEILSSNQKLTEFYTKPRPTNTESLYERIPIKAGQQIGEVEGFALLGMLTVDTNVKLAGFVTPALYKDEPWKIHSVPFFSYFVEPIKSQLLAKNARKKEPVGGKIDFDIDGRLAGNWFLEGTTYSGNQKNQGYCGDYLCPYWDTHLAFVHDFVDTDQIRVSIGYDTGIAENGPFGIKVNSPNPKDVGVSTGLIKYELVALKDVGEEFNIITQGKAVYTRNSDKVVGTLLVQMIDNRSIKIEAFPEKTASQVSMFTENARTYKR